MRKSIIALMAMSILTLIASCGGERSHNTMLAKLFAVQDQNIADSTLATGWYYISDSKKGFKRQLDKTDIFYFVLPKPVLVKEHFDKMEIYEPNDFKGSEDYPFGIRIQIHRNYEKQWEYVTGNSNGKRLALIIDNKLVNAPMINARIMGGKSSLNRGVYSKAELESFIKQIEE